MAKQIMIPDERAAQLEKFASDHGVKVSEMIGLLVEWAIEAGKVKDEIPGIAIYRDGKKVDIDLGDWKKSMSLLQADAFTTKLRQTIRAALTPAPDNLLLPAPDFGAIISRHGPGVKIVDSVTGAQKTLAKSVAGDIARMIDTAAKKD